MHGMSSQAKAVFLWGTKEEVLSRSRADVPAFRLCRAGGELPPVELPFLAPGAEVVRTIVRGGRVVASVYEDEDAQYLLAAGVLPADLAAARGAQATSVFHELEAVLAEELA